MLHNCHRRQSCTTHAWPPISYCLACSLLCDLLSLQLVRNCFEPLGGDGVTAPDIDFAQLSA